MQNTREERQEAAADKVFINGIVYSGGKNPVWTQAVAVKNGRLIKVGNTDTIQEFVGHNTEVIGLEGKLLMPSFFESHCHAQAMTQLMFSVNVTECNSLDEYVESIEKFVGLHSDYCSITGNGWTNTLFPPVGPNKEILDKISEIIPIAIWSVDHHSLWVNSKALELAGITKDTLNPRGGTIERYSSGDPSGTLREGAADMVINSIPDFTVDQYKEGILEYQRMAHSMGFTGCFDAVLTAGGNAIMAYKELAADSLLKMYFRGAYQCEPGGGSEQIDELIELRNSDNVSDLFQINTVKFFADGVIEGGTAYLTEPYEEGAHKAKGYCGEPIWEKENLQKTFTKAERHGFQIHVHSIGDAAAKDTLDAFEFSKGQNEICETRHAVTHLQLVDPADIKRFKELGVIAVLNPYWFGKDEYFFGLSVPYLGDRAEREYPMKSFIDAGVLIASASDFPVTDIPNPFAGIQCGITRTVPDFLISTNCCFSEAEKHKQHMWPEEKAALSNMIDSFTYNGAVLNFLESETGSIEIGKAADLIILDKNIFEVEETEICNIKVLMTVFQGNTVYSCI